MPAAVGPGDPVFTAIVSEGRLLSAAKAADAALLGNRWLLADGLRDPSAPDRVIGMFAIAGAALEDYPEDIERRFVLTCAEISRLVGHFVVIDGWHAAQAARQATRRDVSEQTSRAADVSTHTATQTAKARDGRPKEQQAAMR